MTTDSVTPAVTPHADIAAAPNTLAALTAKARVGRVTWPWPLIMCFVRLPILALGFVVTLGIAQARGQPHAATFAQGITRYDLPVVADIICLLLLLRLTRREGLSLRDLLLASRKYFLRDLVVGVGLFLVTYIVLFALTAGGVLAAYFLTSAHDPQALQTLQASATINPLGLPWHLALTTLIIPLTAGFTEEMVYRGYALPRMQVLTGRPKLAIFLMAAGFGAQHIAYSLVNWQMALVGFLTTFVAGLIFGVFYHITRQRLLPLIVIHWQTDLISLGIAPLLLSQFVH